MSLSQITLFDQLQKSDFEIKLKLDRISILPYTEEYWINYLNIVEVYFFIHKMKKTLPASMSYVKSFVNSKAYHISYCNLIICDIIVWLSVNTGMSKGFA